MNVQSHPKRELRIHGAGRLTALGAGPPHARLSVAPPGSG